MEILFSTLLFPATKCYLHYHFYQNALQSPMVHIQFWHYACSSYFFIAISYVRKIHLQAGVFVQYIWFVVRHLLENCTHVTYTNLLLR